MDNRDLLPKIRTDLEQKYADKHWNKEWSEESDRLLEIMNKIFVAEDRRIPHYGYMEVRGLGTTAVVLVVWDHVMNAKRAMKIPRPRIDFGPEIREAFQGEIQRLLSLNHQNVVKIYYQGDVEVVDRTSSTLLAKYPFFVMEFVEHGSDLGEALGPIIQTPTELLACIRQAATGLEFLHSQGIVHFDMKPGNILVDASSNHAMVTDLGFSKKIDDSTLGTELFVRFTEKYAHPDLIDMEISRPDGKRDPSGGKRAKVPIKDMTDIGMCKRFDRFALGKTIFELLSSESEPVTQLSAYQLSYLRLIAARLLDGKNRGDERWQNLPNQTLKALNYRDTAELRVDTDKLCGEYSLESVIPELNTYIPDVIQIPEIPGFATVPFTPRIKRIIDTPAFLRLYHITQLGLLIDVYPSASHKRSEHALGTFAATCEYVRALYADEHNPLFRSIMGKNDIETLLVASLLHDIGQYPLAHDLEDVADSGFDHERFGQDIINSAINIPGMTTSFLDVITGDDTAVPARDRWEVQRDTLLRLVGPQKVTDFRETILKAIINGPLDADKLDYSYRDTTHLGVAYGNGVDFPRLMKCLTICLTRDTHQPVLGLLDKGRVAGEAVASARCALFNAVYWHHTAREIKAMIYYIVSLALQDCSEKKDEEKFRKEFKSFVFGHGFLDRQPRLGEQPLAIDSSPYGTQADPEDIRILEWLALKCDSPVAYNLLTDLKRRRPYKRFVEIGPGGPIVNNAIEIKNAGSAAVEERRTVFQDLLTKGIAVISKDVKDKLDDQVNSKLEGRPVVLLDISWRKQRTTPVLLVRPGHAGLLEILEPSEALKPLYDNDAFSKQSGYVRVFVNPGLEVILAPFAESAKVWLKEALE